MEARLRISRISLGFALMMVIANATFAQKVTTDYNLNKPS
jgi:hypothetical protein